MVRDVRYQVLLSHLAQKRKGGREEGRKEGRKERRKEENKRILLTSVLYIFNT
jgi:predicted transposase YdaD